MATKAEALHVDCGKQPICGCIGFCRGEAHGTGVRTGAQYVEGIRDDGRQVIHNGEIISDVTSAPGVPRCRAVGRQYLRYGVRPG